VLRPQGDEVKIRDAHSEDVEGIARVHVASWRSTYRGMIPDPVLDELDVSERRKMWQRILELPHTDTFVVAPPLVGFCNLSRVRGSRDGGTLGEITAIYLLEEYWRLGLGRRLVLATLSRARQRRYQTIGLWVLRANDAARRFYESVGFSQSGAERVDTALIGTPLPEVRYQIEVSTPTGSLQQAAHRRTDE